VLQIPLPPDGVLVFNNVNFAVRPTDSNLLNISFVRNAGNSPATLLVSGNIAVGPSVNLTTSGDTGVTASTNDLGKGGLPGPGGFKGGDGAYQLVNFAGRGGSGLGPGGGAGGNDNHFNSGFGGNATFLGAPDLLPLVGGSGGGGGASTSAAPACAGGGGGGGGGALLIAANGTITINGQVLADGGSQGNTSNGNCGSNGGLGSGGAVRLLATTIAGTGSVFARGGFHTQTGQRGTSGSIRMEALNNTMNVSATIPLAARAAGPGPIVNPVTPTVAILTIAGNAISPTPQGSFGGIDIVLSAPGQTTVEVGTTGVPPGTVVDVSVKPQVGGTPAVLPVTLANCTQNAECLANVTINLPAGAYFVEARATFQTP
jgi:hypothetical protein